MKLFSLTQYFQDQFATRPLYTFSNEARNASKCFSRNLAIQIGFRYCSNVYKRAFCENNWQLSPVNYFRKKLHFRCFAEFWKSLCNTSKHVERASWRPLKYFSTIPKSEAYLESSRTSTMELTKSR